MTYGFRDLGEYKVVKRFKVLRYQVIFLLHVPNLKVDQASIGENDKSLLPVTEETLALLPERTDLSNRREVVPHDLTSKSGVSLLDFLLEALVAHD